METTISSTRFLVLVIPTLNPKPQTLNPIRVGFSSYLCHMQTVRVSCELKSKLLQVGYIGDYYRGYIGDYIGFGVKSLGYRVQTPLKGLRRELFGEYHKGYDWGCSKFRL